MKNIVYVVLANTRVVGVYSKFEFAQKMAEAGFSASAERERGGETPEERAGMRAKLAAGERSAKVKDFSADKFLDKMHKKHTIIPIEMDDIDFHLLHKSWAKKYLDNKV